MNLKNAIIGLIVALGIGYGVGRYLQPAEIKIEVREIIKEVETEKRDIITVIKEIERPDGTKETVTTIADKTIIAKDKTKINTEKTEIKALKAQWRVSGLVGMNYKSSLREGTIYGVKVEKRFIGPLSLGAWGMTNSTAGFSASWEF